MKRFLSSMMLAVAALGAAMFAGVSPAAATVCVGNCGTLNGANGSVTAAPNGSAYQYVSSYNGASGAGQIAGVSGGTTGSQFTTDNFTVTAGSQLKFNFNYITSDGGAYSDYAFAELVNGSGAHVAWLFTARTAETGNTSPGNGLPANDATLTPGSSAIQTGTTFDPLGISTGANDFNATSGKCYASGCGNTGWITSAYSISQAGSYAVRYGVTNVSDNSYQSALAFNGLSVGGQAVGGGAGAVPEPAAWMTMIAGFGMIGAVLRGRRRQSALA